MNASKLLPIALVVAACASSEQTMSTAAPQPAVKAAVAIEPAGTYEFSTVIPDGQSLTGTLYITGTPTAYTGRIVTNLFPEIPVVGAKVEDKTVIVMANMPEGELTLRMVMDGMNFTGQWALGPDAGDFSGKKLPK